MIIRVRNRGKVFSLALGIVLPGVIAAICIQHVMAAGTPAATIADVAYFEQQVRPLLQANCLKCHGAAEKIKGNLRLTTRDAVLKGGDDGPVVSLANADKSLILAAINYGGELKMPPSAKLSQEKIDILTKWVKGGLAWTPGLNLAPDVVAAPSGRPDPPTPEEARKNFWSFQPVKRSAVPQVKDGTWIRNPIDAFILAKLEEQGLKPAPPADKISLLRRATYDLTGLPPTPAEMDAFIADQSVDAYEKVIDRLIDSPHYGEKWGRHWLDLVRYGESTSYERDDPKPNVWRYRDYVIRSFNTDKPYDQFAKEQLAGDEMPQASANSDPIIATGYYRLGIFDDEPNDRLQARYDNLDDIVTTTGQVFLGLTVDCARCHNHKIDPILQTDYYRLLAFFQNISDYHNGGRGDEAEIFNSSAQHAAYKATLAANRKKSEEIHARVIAIQEAFRTAYLADKGLNEQKKEKKIEGDLGRLVDQFGKDYLGQKKVDEYRKLRHDEDVVNTPPVQERALCVTENGRDALNTFVCLRGNANVLGDKVMPGFPKVLVDGDAAIPAPAPDAHSSGRRTVLANWMTSAENPLFPRVMANRIFQYHFGRGIVRSPNNFGVQGDRPTHPELLDWLASEFRDGGYRFKPLHRMIMTSSAYRMSSRMNPEAQAADPQNALLSHFDLRRLTAEEVRDSILSVDGTLNPKMYGPSVYPIIPREVMATQSVPGRNWEKSTAKEAARRSVYVHVKRSLLVPILQAFDAAETDRSCPVRFVTVQPTQALGMLNGLFINEEASKFADRLRSEAGDDRAKQIELAFRLVAGRKPTESEIKRCVDLMGDLQNTQGASPKKAMDYFCLMMLNLNEFVYLD